MSKAVLGRFEPHTYALLRFMSGLMFIFHGTQKLFGWPGDKPPSPLASLRGLGGIIEVVGGAMIALGLFAGIAAFLASGMMAVAYFMSHAKGGFLPIVNRGELAVLFCFVFLYISARGSGIWSLESMVSRGRRG